VALKSSLQQALLPCIHPCSYRYCSASRCIAQMFCAAGSQQGAGHCSTLVVLECGRLCFMSFIPKGWKLLQGFCSVQDGGGSFPLPALRGLTLQNNPQWVQGFASSESVGGEVTDKINLKGKSSLREAEPPLPPWIC